MRRDRRDRRRDTRTTGRRRARWCRRRPTGCSSTRDFGFDARGGAAPLPRRARCLARLPVAGAGSRRRARPTATTWSTTAGSTRSSAARTASPAVAALHAHGLGVGRRRGPQPHGRSPTPAHLNRRAVVGAARRPRLAVRAAGSTSTGSPRTSRVLLPVLGAAARQAAGGRRAARSTATAGRDGDEPVLRYFDHEFPVRPGHRGRCRWPSWSTAQWYRLAYWRVADEELNYRRFFDVDTLVGRAGRGPGGLRRRPTACCSTLVRDGVGRRAADRPPRRPGRPARLPARLADATGDAWVVVEKILEGDERAARRLALRRHHRLRRAAARRRRLRRPGRRAGRSTDLLTEVVGAPRTSTPWSPDGQAPGGRRQVQAAEVHRLMRPASTQVAAVGDDQAVAAPCARARCSSRWTATAPTSSPGRGRRRPGRGRSTRPSARAVAAWSRRRPADALDLVAELARGGRLPGAARRRWRAAASSSCGSSRPAAR